MTREANQILKKALTLPVAERAELAVSLVESSDGAKDESVPAAWDKEIVRRVAQLDCGKVKPVSLDQARWRLSGIE